MIVAMIGAGSRARRAHYPALAMLENVEIGGICDLDEAAMASVADAYGIEKRFRDYKKMIATVQPDAVYAIGQPATMYPIWVWCLQQGLHLFIEKPMGVSLHESRHLAHLAAGQNCITQVAFQRRACPMLVRLKEECVQRGPIVHAVCRFYKHDLRPMFAPGGRMMDDGVHAIDVLRWACGGEVVDVKSVAKRVGVPDLNFFAAILGFSNGSTGILLNSWSSGRRIFDVEMHARGICVQAENEGKGRMYADGDTQGIAYDTRAVAGSDESYVWDGTLAKHRSFIDGVLTGSEPDSNFADALKTMEVAERIQSAGLLQFA